MIKHDLDQVAAQLGKMADTVAEELGMAALEEFRENFRRGGFFAQGTWPKRAGNIDQGRGVLVGKGGGRKLSRSLQVKVANGVATIFTLVPYAKAHNEGVDEVVSISAHNVRAHTRKRKGKRYKVKAHGRGGHRKRMRLPQRQFMGRHQSLDKMLSNILNDHLKQL